MSDERDIDLINDLVENADETTWLEFKKDNIDPKVIGIRCSALSNSARIEGKDFAYMMWGIANDKSIVGTDFNFDTEKVGNQVMQLWLSKKLNPSINFRFKSIEHPNGRLVLLEIPAATSSPLAFDGIPYIRIGEATPKLMEYPERYQKLLECLLPYTWEHGIAKKYVSSDDVLELLDYSRYFKLTEQPLPDNRNGIFEKLIADQIITKDVGGRWNITNLGAILFADDLTKFHSSIARKAVRFISYKGKNRASQVNHRQDGKRGYARGFSNLITFINNLLPQNEHIGEAFREAKPLFPELAIRELVANALIHQDMTITGTGPQVELFEDRIEITNPGKPLVKADRMIDLPPRSRNETLAALMRRMKMCEEQGSGLDKVISIVELYQLPPPLFNESQAAMQVILYAPRSFADMTPDERVRACFQHSILKLLSGERMKNSSLCERLGIDKTKNAAQATAVINKALADGYIKPADAEHPRAGYVPIFA